MPNSQAIQAIAVILVICTGQYPVYLLAYIRVIFIHVRLRTYLTHMVVIVNTLLDGMITITCKKRLAS